MDVYRTKVILKRFKAGYSLSRYGDGEFKMINGGSITNMQQYDKTLKHKLIKVFERPLEKLLIGIPDPLCTRSWIPGFHTRFDEFISKKPARKQSTFVSAFFFRPRLINMDTVEYFAAMKNIWKEREVVLVNFNLALSEHFLFRDNKCEFIQITRNDSFLEYERILNACRRFYRKNKLFLISAGPTATCLAYDLCSEGEQAIDIGAAAFEQSLYNSDANPEKWNYQDSYRLHKRGFLRGINDILLNDVETNIRHTKDTLQERKDAGIILNDNIIVRLTKAFMDFVDYSNKELPFLDIGAREGWFLEFLMKAGYSEVHAIDVCPSAIDVMQDKGLDAIEIDVQEMNFSERFGTISAIHVLEHCSKPQKAVNNICSALKKGGILYVEIPLETNFDSERSAHFSSFPEAKDLFVLFNDQWETLFFEVIAMNKAGTKRNCRIVFKKR